MKLNVYKECQNGTSGKHLLVMRNQHGDPDRGPLNEVHSTFYTTINITISMFIIPPNGKSFHPYDALQQGFSSFYPCDFSDVITNW